MAKKSPPAPRKPKVWRVVDSAGSAQVIEAHHLDISDTGILSFHDQGNQLSHAFAEGAWRTLELVPPPEEPTS